MHKFKRKCIIITILALIFSSTMVCAVENNNIQNNVNNNQVNTTKNENNLEQDGTATKILKMKDEQLKSVEDYKAKYNSDKNEFFSGKKFLLLYLLLLRNCPIPIHNERHRTSDKQENQAVINYYLLRNLQIP